MKVSSKDLYAILRDTLGPVMKEAGFKRLKIGMLGWSRAEGQWHTSVWFQCDKYGWFECLGSTFTLEFQLATDPSVGSMGFDRRSRFEALLTADEREKVREMNNRVLRSLPPPQPRDPASALRKFYQVREEPYGDHEDNWLHFYTPQDVDAWATFFKHRLPRMAIDFEARVQELTGTKS